MITDLYEHADHHADRFSVSGLHGLICVRPTYATATWLFLQLLGVAYFFAFWSLSQQILGLIGHDGIVPAAEFMADLQAWAVPARLAWTAIVWCDLCWLATSDVFLQGLAFGGAVAAMLIAGSGASRRSDAYLDRLSVADGGCRRLPVVPVGRVAPRDRPAGNIRRAVHMEATGIAMRSIRRRLRAG